MFLYIYSFVLGYVIGSLPTAYLMVKRTKGVDIRVSGSGNVGAMNAFEVTESKWIGIIVMLGDLVKGLFSVLLSLLIFGSGNQIALGIVGTSVVLGHNYPIWLKFKGGRGLATGAGVLLALNWIFVIIWCALWGIIYKLFKNIHKANILASIFGMVIIAFLPATLWNSILPVFVHQDTALYVPLAICVLILLRHTEYMRSMFSTVHQS